jgi:WD40 repeat protein
MATADLGGSVSLWNMRTGDSSVTYGPREKDQVRVIAFSPDGKLWATGHDSGLVTVRELVGGTQVYSTTHKSTISALAFGPHSRALAISGAKDGALIVWGMDEDSVVLQPTVRRDTISALAFSAHGSRLAVGDAGGELWLCAGPGEPSACLPVFAQDAGIVDLGFRRDGEQIVVRDDTGTLRIWDLDADAWIVRACRVANRALTEEEWAQYVVGAPYQPTCGKSEEEK